MPSGATDEGILRDADTEILANVRSPSAIRNIDENAEWNKVLIAFSVFHSSFVKKIIATSPIVPRKFWRKVVDGELENVN